MRRCHVADPSPPKVRVSQLHNGQELEVLPQIAMEASQWWRDRCAKENTMALQFGPRNFDGDTCKENEFRAFAGCARMMNARERRCDLGVVGMVILAKDKSHDVGFLRVMEFRDGGLSWCRSRARVHGSDAIGFLCYAIWEFKNCDFFWVLLCLNRDEEDDVNGCNYGRARRKSHGKILGILKVDYLMASPIQHAKLIGCRKAKALWAVIRTPTNKTH
ncbi:hypothetical protein V8G54_016800 [Vigna mungo]|uniref:Uncharacterized protein n=1 Tax=Vigna mungo TaxID=3915 RepID=A0AAQ3NKU1_VIGMU